MRHLSVSSFNKVIQNVEFSFFPYDIFVSKLRRKIIKFKVTSRLGEKIFKVILRRSSLSLSESCTYFSKTPTREKNLNKVHVVRFLLKTKLLCLFLCLFVLEQLYDIHREHNDQSPILSRGENERGKFLELFSLLWEADWRQSRELFPSTWARFLMKINFNSWKVPATK